MEKIKKKFLHKNSSKWKYLILKKHKMKRQISKIRNNLFPKKNFLKNKWPKIFKLIISKNKKKQIINKYNLSEIKECQNHNL
jgi:hypothetical protein